MKNLRLIAWQWGTVALLVVGYTGYYVCRTDLSVCKSSLLHDFGSQGLTKNSLGIIDTVSVGAYVVGKFLNGVSSDFLGGKRMFVFGMIVSLIVTILFGLSSAFPIFLALWTLNRFVQSMGWPSLVKITSNWFSYHSYGRAMAVLSLSFLLGNFLVKQFLGMLLAHNFTWRQVFFSAAAALAIIALANLIFLETGPANIGEPEQEINPHNLFGEAGNDARPHSIGSVLSPFLTNPGFWLIAVLSFGFTLLRETFNNWTPLYLSEVGKFSEANAARYSGNFDLFGAVSVLLCGFLADKIANGKRGPIMAIGLFATTLILASMNTIHVGDQSRTLWSTALIGLLMLGPYTFLAGAISLDIGGKRGSGTAAGLVDGIGYIGGMISGYGVSAVATKHGWGAAFSMLAIVSAIGAVTAVLYWIRVERAPVRIHDDVLVSQ